MRILYIVTSGIMTIKELLRSRIALVLLIVIPALFFIIVDITASERDVYFQLPVVSDTDYIEVPERAQSMIFLGLTAVGFLASFLALILIQKHIDAHRRLVLSGYRPSELIISKLSVMIVVILILSVYVSLLLLIFISPERTLAVMIGFSLGGFVYACYGLLVGALIRRELEGILLIVLLANIDIGWLQNPLFYAEAQNQALIRHLPAFYPSQASMIGAFTQHSLIEGIIGSILYGMIFLVAAVIVYRTKMRVRK